ncbi:sporulation histidine kinase inhibitor Sda [Metabacillus sediminilitoris]|uniref:sporulation histidine kinase inhibitor Sda n=1 Tax=Metabacillus sediminilitoris TaxID=2567941 RepID=UPI001D0D9EA7|nr:sporulation histidine kinase inhibitor Sda [Metabacillus sediminilitoris]
MRFSTLSDKTLLKSYHEASKLQVCEDFIKMLEKEIDARGLSLLKPTNKIK